MKLVNFHTADELLTVRPILFELPELPYPKGLGIEQ